MDFSAPKVVIAAPTFIGKDYCFERWLENVESISYPNKILFLADNSPDRSYYKKISKKGIRCEWIDPKGKPVHKVLAESHNACREFALSVKADYLFHLETDVFPKNPNVIWELMIANKPVINGMYDVGKGNSRRTGITVMPIGIDSDVWKDPQFIGDNEITYADGTIKRCFNAGLGCCLIKRSMLENYKFEFHESNKVFVDFMFAKWLWNSGIENSVHTGQWVEHENSEDWL